MPLIGMTVAQESATLPGYGTISIHADHRDMVRFLNPQDPGFQKLVGELSRWSQAANKMVKAKENYLTSLIYPEMGAREANIDPPAQNTCEWIFQKQGYQKWDACKDSDRSTCLLWIKGKPGSGKSTLMKTIVQKRANDGRGVVSRTVRIAFFFNARGAKLEKSQKASTEHVSTTF